jgi:hypothetical protein
MVALERETPKLVASEHESCTEKRSYPETRSVCGLRDTIRRPDVR